MISTPETGSRLERTTQDILSKVLKEFNKGNRNLDSQHLLIKIITESFRKGDYNTLLSGLDVVSLLELPFESATDCLEGVSTGREKVNRKLSAALTVRLHEHYKAKNPYAVLNDIELFDKLGLEPVGDVSQVINKLRQICEKAIKSKEEEIKLKPIERRQKNHRRGSMGLKKKIVLSLGAIATVATSADKIYKGSAPIVNQAIMAVEHELKNPISSVNTAKNFYLGVKEGVQAEIQRREDSQGFIKNYSEKFKSHTSDLATSREASSEHVQPEVALNETDKPSSVH